MIIVDTSVWVDHFRSANPELTTLLRAGRIRMHPYIVGELAMGNLRAWQQAITGLRYLPAVPVVGENEFYSFIFENHLMGAGLNFVDVHLMASALHLGETTIWSRDRRLNEVAERLGCYYFEA